MKSIRDLGIVFIGTPDFAVASLDALIKAGARVLAVITAPDKPAGRGMQLQQSAVKQYAVGNGLPVLQPVKLKEPEFVAQVRALAADLHVVVAFRMLPEAIWNMPPLGTINVHASLLPQYRGAAPINWAIINGETETGVTTFKLKHEIDTGDILLQRRMPISANDDAGTLHDLLMHAGAGLLVETVDGLAAGTLQELPQDQVPDRSIRHAPKLFHEHRLIDWNRPVAEIRNLIRGLAPYPAAVATLGGKAVKIYKSHVEEVATVVAPGCHVIAGGVLKFAGADGFLVVDELQMEGKKRLPAAEFLKGYRE